MLAVAAGPGRGCRDGFCEKTLGAASALDTATSSSKTPLLPVKAETVSNTGSTSAMNVLEQVKNAARKL